MKKSSKKIIGMICLAVLALVVALLVALNPFSEKSEEDKVHYDAQGKLLTGMQELDGATFIFDDEGRIMRGWITYKEATYHQTEQGISKGECVIDGKNYRFEDDGRFLSGMYEENGEYYCRNAYGYFEEGIFLVNGERYFSKADGKVVLGWQEIDGEMYYFSEETGVMATGSRKIENKYYLFDEEGKQVTGWYEKDGDSYYYGEDGVMAIGWQVVGEVKYYFTKTGVRYDDGLLELEDGTYYLNEDGTVWVGWMLADDKYFYYDETGKMAVGQLSVDDIDYNFGEDGWLRNGWVEDQYYVNGYLMSGATEIDGKLYLLDTNGRKMSDGWHTVSSRKYYVNGDGVLATGFTTLDGKKYYFDSKGRMAVGITKVDGKKYYFYQDGTMAVNVTIDNYQIDANGVVTDLFTTITEENLDDYIEYLLDKHGRSTLDIYNYVRDTFPYRYREKKSINEMACRMLNYGNGACWDYAALTYKMLTAAGYNCQIVIGKGAVYSEHNWILIEIEPGVWRHLDTERKSLRVYLWTDEQLKAKNGISPNVRYEWDYDAYPKAE